MTKQVYRAYALVAAFFALLTLSPMVNADFQCDQQGKDVHACADANNCNNELFLTTPVMPNFQQGNTQTCQVFQKFMFDKDELPFELLRFRTMAFGDCIRIGAPGTRPGGCEFYETSSDETCTLTDVNGDTRQVNRFYSTFVKLPNDSRTDYYTRKTGDRITLEASVLCSDDN